MPLTKMEHYLVLTKDIDATRDFYCRVLGMKDGFRPPLGFPGYWLYLGETPVHPHRGVGDVYRALQLARHPGFDAGRGHGRVRSHRLRRERITTTCSRT